MSQIVTTSPPSIDLLWLMFCTVLILCMQAGFLCLESGAVSRKNTVNVAVKNLLDLCFAGLCFLFIGYALAYSESINGLFGNVALSNDLTTPDTQVRFLYLMMFCGTAVTIISGAIAERTTLAGYLCLAVITSTLIYPVMCHWIWSDGGWLSQRGFVDFAGSTVVHGTGGWLALVACLIIGPRQTWQAGAQPRAGYNLTYSALGALLIWIGWLGFNGGSSMAFSNRVPGIFLNTMFAGVAGIFAAVISTVAFSSIKKLRFEVIVIALISALVGVTASVHALTMTNTIILGMICAFVGLFSHSIILSKGVDDVIGAIASHGVAGACGTILLPFFADATLLNTGLPVIQQFYIQCIGVASNIAWCLAVGGLLFYLANKIVPFRVTSSAERIGLDQSEHQARNALAELHQQIKDYRAGDATELAGDINTEEGLLATEFRELAIQADLSEKEKQAAFASKQRADRSNEAKSQFLANMSHELRTPLNGILGTLDLVLEDKLDNELRRDLSMAKNSSEHLLTLLNDLLDTAKLESGEIQLEQRATDLKVLLDGIHNTFTHTAKQKNVALEISIDAESLPYVKTDPTRLKQVLLNLVGNALKFTASGYVRLTTTMVNHQDTACTINFSVTDTGPGIPQDALESIFERFRQADASTTRNFGGTGLGLALCKDLVELMGGKITVTSVVDEGSCFSFELPFDVCEHAIEANSLSETYDKHNSAADRKVLVAEDNPTNQMVVSKMLKRLGYEAVEIVSNGAEAVQRWLNTEYAIILMDCQMPVMDGLDATQKIRQLERQLNRSSIPIVAVTANASMLDKQECLDAGMTSHISKPLRVSALAELLETELPGLNSGTELSA